MPTETTIRAISLGTHRDLDNREYRTGAERADDLVGRSFGSLDQPLANSISEALLHDGNDDGSIEFDNGYGGPAGEYMNTGDGNNLLDTGVLYSGTITYMDGTSATGIPLRVLQDTDGNLFLVPPPTDASTLEVNALTTRAIQSISITGVQQNNFGSLNASRYGLEDAPTFLCFRNGTLIRTSRGDVPVEELSPGDMIITRDHGPQPLRWIGSKKLGTAVLRAFEKLRPVRIGAGTLGNGLPGRDLYVSQQHRVLVSSCIAQRMFGQDEVLVAAKHLTAIDGIEIDDSNEELEYFHLLFDCHEILCSEGAQTESLFTGPEALRAVDPAARSEILALFPELLTQGSTRAPARHLGTGHKVKQLAKRHAGNHRELQQAL